MRSSEPTKASGAMMVQEKAGYFRMRSARLFGAASLLLSLAFVGVSLAQETPRKVIAKTAPSYPELARRMHLSGKVKVAVVISAAGSVTSSKFIGGNPVFEISAVEAVKLWKFETAASATKTVIVLEFAEP
jgi:TonB family protein